MKKVLVPTDFSANSKAGIRFALQWASQENIELVFIHVLHILRASRWTDSYFIKYAEQEELICDEKFEKHIADIFKKHIGKVPKYSKVIIRGIAPDLSILEYCRKHKNIDYVCLSTRGAGKVERVIASDVNRKPLEKAMMTSRGYNLETSIEFRLGFGLEVLSKGEVRGAIIAGMGGELTQEILEKSLELVKELDFLLLQPAQNQPSLRRYLYSGNYKIISEELVQEVDGRFYEYFLVRYQEKSPEIFDEPMDYVISPRLRKDQHPLLKEFIESKIMEIESIQEKLDQSFQSSREKNVELTNQKKYLKEMLLWL